MRQKLCQEHLIPDRGAADRHVTVLIHVMKRAFYHLIGGVKAVIVGYNAVICHRTIKEFGFNPAGTHRHHAYAPAPDLGVHRSGKAQNKC